MNVSDSELNSLLQCICCTSLNGWYWSECANFLTAVSEQHVNRVYENNRMVCLVAELRTGLFQVIFPAAMYFLTENREALLLHTKLVISLIVCLLEETYYHC